MCGIVGVLHFEDTFTKASDLALFFKQALIADTLRGEDSTGIMALAQDGTLPETFKKAIPGWDFVNSKTFAHYMRDIEHFPMMVGHNRWATMGKVNSLNAHPFQEKHITLVHNGSIRNHRQLTGGNLFDVDSQAICNAIATDGINAVAKQMDGAFALVWHDAKEQSFNILRNSERPLAVGVARDINAMLIASEMDMLKWLAAREKTNIAIKSFHNVPVGKHFKWMLKDRDVNAFTEKEVAFKEPYNWGGYNTYNTHKKDGTSTKKPDSGGKIGTQMDMAGVKFGDTIYMEATHFNSYQGRRNMGKLYLMPYPGYDYGVICHDVNARKIDIGSYYKGKVNSASVMEGSEDWPMIVVSTVEKVTDDEMIKYLMTQDESKGSSEVEPPTSFPEKKHSDTPNTSTAKEELETEEDTESDQIQIDPFVRGPGGVHIPIREFQERTKYGCSLCSADLTNPLHTHWDINDAAYCEYCWDKIENTYQYGKSFH